MRRGLPLRARGRGDNPRGEGGGGIWGRGEVKLLHNLLLQERTRNLHKYPEQKIQLPGNDV